MDKPILTCGHSPNAVTTMPDGSKKPSCAVCGCVTEAAQQPDLTERQMCCSYGKHGIRKSDPKEAFFEHRPQEQMDRYYCGCYGWD